MIQIEVDLAPSEIAEAFNDCSTMYQLETLECIASSITVADQNDLQKSLEKPENEMARSLLKELLDIDEPSETSPGVEETLEVVVNFVRFERATFLETLVDELEEEDFDKLRKFVTARAEKL